MSPKLPVLSGNDMIKILLSKGFARVKQKGSHVKMKKVTKKGTWIVIIPLHSELAPGTLKSILKQSGLNIEDLLQNK